MDIKKIFENNNSWIADRLKEDKDYFNKLSLNQKPEILYIGCSDSRVTAEEIMGLGPGEAFVHRNIANLAVSIDINLTTVLNFAITNLGVKHIIICGHYGCGGIEAAVASDDLGVLNPWLQNIKDVYRIHKEKLDLIKTKEGKLNKLVELNVQEQCTNLLKTSLVQKAFFENKISLHGWVFDISNGELKDLKLDFTKISKEVEEIYHLN